MRANLIVAFFIISLIWLTPATARSYRWVDENGVTIYSQSPPPSGTAASVIKPPPPAATPPGETMDKLKARLKAMDEENKKADETKDKEKEEAERAETDKKNCQRAAANLKTLEEHARVKMKMNDGSYKMLPDETRTANIKKIKQYLEKKCK